MYAWMPIFLVYHVLPILHVFILGPSLFALSFPNVWEPRPPFVLFVYLFLRLLQCIAHPMRAEACELLLVLPIKEFGFHFVQMPLHRVLVRQLPLLQGILEALLPIFALRFSLGVGRPRRFFVRGNRIRRTVW